MGNRISSSRTPASSVPRGPAAQVLARAHDLRQKGLTGEAIEAMRLAARLEPNSAVVFHDLGLICLEAGLGTEAAAAFKRAIQIKPTFAHAYWR